MGLSEVGGLDESIAETDLDFHSVFLERPLSLRAYAGALCGTRRGIHRARRFDRLRLRVFATGLTIPVGLWSDKLGKRKPFIVFAFVASALAALGLALAQGPIGVLAARALSGVSATMWVVITVLFASYYPADRAGQAMSLITFVTTLSQLASTLLGGLMAERWGWHAPFWAALVAASVGFVLTLPLRKVPDLHRT